MVLVVHMAELCENGGATSTKADFKGAAEWMRRNKTLKLSTDQKLTLYGLFKQVSSTIWHVRSPFHKCWPVSRAYRLYRERACNSVLVV